MSKLTKDDHEMLIDMLIAGIYGYHCAVTGKEFKNEDATNEYRGDWTFDSIDKGLKYPILRNIVQSTAGQVLEFIESKS